MGRFCVALLLVFWAGVLLLRRLSLHLRLVSFLVTLQFVVIVVAYLVGLLGLVVCQVLLSSHFICFSRGIQNLLHPVFLWVWEPLEVWITSWAPLEL